ncbi:MAG: phosphate ABC transporter permease PtsA, partial [Syntrophorhabdus sp.]
MNDNARSRLLKDILFKSTIILFALISLLPLLLILYYITKNGIAVINWNFLSSLPRPIGETGGGIFNAIVGTLILIVLSASLSIPCGILAGIYLAEKGTGKLAY